MNTVTQTKKTIKNTNQPFGIKTPTTVEEFRENLKKYYWNMGGDGLYVQQLDKPIKYDQINSLSDLYDLLKNGSRNGTTPWICPKVELKKDIKEFMEETNQYMSCYGLFQNEDHFEIVDDQFEHKNPKWIGIDNQIWREFFYMTLGEFSGYVMNNKEQ